MSLCCILLSVISGITCLFIAAKVEEVYPPKIGEFAYVTDGACTTEEILLEELLILKILSWSITPITINSWLNVYMQLASEGRSAKRRLLGESDVGANALRGYTFVFPQYSSLEFVISGQLIDLAVLHVDVNQYPYSVIAAATMAHSFNKDLGVRVSGEQTLKTVKLLTKTTDFLRTIVITKSFQALYGLTNNFQFEFR